MRLAFIVDPLAGFKTDKDSTYGMMKEGRHEPAGEGPRSAGIDGGASAAGGRLRWHPSLSWSQPKLDR